MFSYRVEVHFHEYRLTEISDRSIARSAVQDQAGSPVYGEGGMDAERLLDLIIESELVLVW